MLIFSIKITMMVNDTIIAPATPYGRSGIGIIRISGSQSKYVAKKILRICPIERKMYYSPFWDHNGLIIDEGIALWFPGPHSFTGEDVLELQGHGNPIILDILIKSILKIKNIRIAKPGEFSERSFLNGKIDLIQAESIIQLINADSKFTIQSAIQSLRGNFSHQINELIKIITNTRVFIESLLNFPDEELDIHDHQISINLKKINLLIKKIDQASKTGKKLNNGVKVIIVGLSNVGKSSIFNSLTMCDSAIVTNIKGTTRDILHEDVLIDDIEFKITDTAGFRRTNNIIEKIGIDKTLKELKNSDHILLVLDSTVDIHINYKIISKFFNKFSKKDRVTILLNKIDLVNDRDLVERLYDKYNSITVSAKTGYGITKLKKYLKKTVIKTNYYSSETVFLARTRHLRILKSVRNILDKTIKNWKISKNFEFLSEDLKQTQNFLNEITGKITSQDILNNIFSKFCIGK